MYQPLTYYDFESDFEYQLQLHETLMSRSAVEYNRAATEEYFKSRFGADGEVTERGPPLPATHAELSTSVTQFMNLFQRNQSYRQACAAAAAAATAAASPQCVQIQKVLHVAHAAPNSYHISQMVQVSHTTSQEHTVRQISQQVYHHLQQAPDLFHPPSGPSGPSAPLALTLTPIPASAPDFYPCTDDTAIATATTSSSDDPALRTLILRNLKQRILNVIKDRNSHCQLKRQVAIMDALSDVLDRDPLRVLELVGYQAVLCQDEFNIPKTARNADEESVRRNDRKLQEMAEEFCLMDLSLDVIRACDKHPKVRKRLYEHSEPNPDRS